MGGYCIRWVAMYLWEVTLFIQVRGVLYGDACGPVVPYCALKTVLKLHAKAQIEW